MQEQKSAMGAVCVDKSVGTVNLMKPFNYKKYKSILVTRNCRLRCKLSHTLNSDTENEIICNGIYKVHKLCLIFHFK